VAESNCRLTESIRRPENQRFMPTSTRLDFEAVEHSDRDELLTSSKVAVAHGFSGATPCDNKFLNLNGFHPQRSCGRQCPSTKCTGGCYGLPCLARGEREIGTSGIRHRDAAGEARDHAAARFRLTASARRSREKKFAKHSAPFRRAAEEACRATHNGDAPVEAGLSTDKDGHRGKVQLSIFTTVNAATHLTIVSSPSAMGTLDVHNKFGESTPSPRAIKSANLRVKWFM
jgi:hypothetical protein